MSFLNQLKSQASARQAEQSEQHTHNALNSKLTEAGAKTTWLYLADLAKQLTVIEPAGPALSLDGKTPWPPMKLVDFRVDARKKTLFDQEVFDYLTETRGSVTITANQQDATLLFRVNNAQGFEVSSTVYPAKDIQAPLLDQLAKLIVGQASSFLNPGKRHV